MRMLDGRIRRYQISETSQQENNSIRELMKINLKGGFFSSFLKKDWQRNNKIIFLVTCVKNWIKLL